MERGGLQAKKFENKRELIAWAPRIGKAYNDAFVNNWEYYPFSHSAKSTLSVDNIITGR